MTNNNITFLEQIIPNNLFCSTNAQKERLYLSDTLEITQFLLTLEHDTVYVVTFDFIFSWMMYDEDQPVISLTKPILITKNSNPRVISKYLNNRIYEACNYYYLDDSSLDLDKNNAPGILINYSKINLF